MKSATLAELEDNPSRSMALTTCHTGWEREVYARGETFEVRGATFGVDAIHDV